MPFIDVPRLSSLGGGEESLKLNEGRKVRGVRGSRLVGREDDLMVCGSTMDGARDAIVSPGMLKFAFAQSQCISARVDIWKNEKKGYTCLCAHLRTARH